MSIIRKETRRVIISMIVLVLIGITVAWFYYRDVNRSEDPRVVGAKIKFQTYQQFADQERYEEALLILDSIESIYNSVEHYRRSFELGVLYNNRSAIYLTWALHFSTDSVMKAKNFNFAADFAEQAIRVYQDWLDEYGQLSEEQILFGLGGDFERGMNVSEKRLAKIKRKRVEELVDAQYETKRRLSVSYTNHGIVKRHQGQVVDAAECYKKALELWDRNLSARNNLNIILDRPLEKQNFIDKMFPPEKEKK